MLDRQRVSYLQQETVVAPVTSQHVMLKMRKRATRILATTTGVGNTVDALSASHGSDRHGADRRHGLDHYWSCRTTHTSPGVYCASTCLAGYASDGYQGCHNLASCLASCAHCDSSMRCKDDVTGAGIVAEAQNTLELQHDRSFPCRNQASHGSDGMTQVHVTQTDGMVSIIDGVAGTTPHPVHNFASTYLRVR